MIGHDATPEITRLDVLYGRGRMTLEYAERWHGPRRKTLNLLESSLARLGWLVFCAHCKRRLPYGTPPAFCHACYHGYGPARTP
jgi:hypothetical protein